MMPDQLRELADRLTAGTHFVDSPELHEAMMKSADFLRQCAEQRPCTCHPDDNPPVLCARQYALSECRAVSGEPTIDLDALSWASIKQAASESKWMPPEYTANDWVSDVCAFLRGREGEPTEAQIEAATDAWQAHCGLLLLSREGARDEVLIVLRAALAAKDE